MSGAKRLTAEHISFGYRADRRILDDVSLSVAPGEVLGLLGPNGTGKTTLIKCIAQLLRSQQGTVRVDGTDLSQRSPGEIAKRIAYVPQYTNAAFGMTALQTVLMGRLPYAGHRYRAEDERIAFDVIARMDLTDFAFRNIQEMSGGERQRVFIARALASLFCDTLLMLKDAHVYAYGQTQEVLTAESVAAMYGVQTCVTVEDGAKHVRLLKDG